MHNVFRHGGRNHSAPLSRFLLFDSPTEFFCQRFRFRFKISSAYIFGGVLDGWIRFIHNHLGDHGYHFAIYLHIPQFILHGLLNHVTDITLGSRHTNTKRKGRHFIMGEIHPEEFIPHLGTIPMIDTKIIATINKMADAI